MDLVLEVRPEEVANHDSRYQIIRASDVHKLVAAKNYFIEDVGFSTVIDGNRVRYMPIRGCYYPVKSPVTEEPERGLGKRLSDEEIKTAERVLELTGFFPKVEFS